MKMTGISALMGTLAAVGMLSSAQAADGPQLIVNGELELTTHVKGPTGGPLEDLYSGWVFRTPETQALQMDDFENPGFIFVDQAQDVWNTAEGTVGKSCADCHGDVESFKGLRATMPKWNAKAGRLFTMEDAINQSLVDYMGAKPWKWGGGKLTAMVALISLQSRGMPMNVATDGPAQSMWEKGKNIYYTRMGQLDMACSNCHEDKFGKMIRADHLSQGQINGFPSYRLKNAKLNSVHARFKGCMKNIRAEPYKVGSDEFRALELYVASRGNGLPVEGVSVRN